MKIGRESEPKIPQTEAAAPPKSAAPTDRFEASSLTSPVPPKVLDASVPIESVAELKKREDLDALGDAALADYNERSKNASFWEKTFPGLFNRPDLSALKVAIANIQNAQLEQKANLEAVQREWEKPPINRTYYDNLERLGREGLLHEIFASRSWENLKYQFAPLLTAAVETGSRKAVSALLRAGVDVNAPYDGMSLLALALRQQKVDVAKTLLKGGADLRASDRVDGTALQATLRSGLAIVDEVLPFLAHKEPYERFLQSQSMSLSERYTELARAILNDSGCKSKAKHLGALSWAAAFQLADYELLQLAVIVRSEPISSKLQRLKNAEIAAQNYQGPNKAIADAIVIATREEARARIAPTLAAFGAHDPQTAYARSKPNLRNPESVLYLAKLFAAVAYDDPAMTRVALGLERLTQSSNQLERFKLLRELAASASDYDGPNLGLARQFAVEAERASRDQGRALTHRAAHIESQKEKQPFLGATLAAKLHFKIDEKPVTLPKGTVIGYAESKKHKEAYHIRYETGSPRERVVHEGYVDKEVLDPILLKDTDFHQLVSERGRDVFGPQGPISDDILQGSIGDCVLLSALSAMADKTPEVVKDMIDDQGDQALVRLYNKNPDGTYGETWIPVRKSVARNSEGAVSQASKKLWPALIENALAIHLGVPIDQISEVEYVRILETLLGASHERKHLAPIYTYLPPINLASEVLFAVGIDPLSEGEFEALRKQFEENPIMVAGTYPFQFAINLRAGAEGLYARHAYTLLNVYRDAQGEPWVTLRNPHGSHGVKFENGKFVESMNATFSMPFQHFRRLFRVTYGKTRHS